MLWENGGKREEKVFKIKGHRQKKVLSLVLCVAVMLSVMVMGAGAAFSDQDKIENTEAVDACSALNILVGYEDGSFHPERNIKRSEVTKMICVALNGGKEPNVSTNAKPTFKDVRGTIHAWAEGYIESCVAQGIVDGVGGGRFAPAGNVTGAQLAKMLLVSLGYNATNEKFTGNAWETNVNVRAAQKHLYDGLEKMDTSAAVTRDQAAQMVWNAMQAYEVEYKDGVVQDKVVGQTDDKITLLRDRYNALISVGTLTGVDKTDLSITMSPAADQLASDKPYVSSFSKLDEDYSALMGQKVKVVYNRNHSDQVLGVFAINDNKIYTTVANETSKDDNKVKFDGKSYSVETNSKGEITTYVDGVLANGTTLDELDANTFNPNVYTFVDSNGNGKLDALIVKTYNVAKVTYVGSDKIIAAGKTYKNADENIAEGLKKDDWVVITRNLFQDKFDVVKAEVQKDTLAALRNNKESESFFDNGTVKGKIKYDQYQIGETWYNSAAAVQGDRSKADLNTVKAGDNVEYVAVNGITFYMKKSTGTNTGRVDNVALIMAADTTGVEDRVKIALFDGTEKTVTVDKDSTVKFADLKGNLGTVYEYTVSGDKYSFEKLQNGVADTKYEEYYGDLTFRGDKTLNKSDLAGDKFDGLKIDDNAQVLLYNPGSKKVADLTGKQFNALDLDNINGKGKGGTVVDGSIVYGFSGDMNGLDRIGALAVQVNAELDKVSNQSWNHYGFITEDAKWITRNKTLTFKMWNGTEEITVQEDHNTLSDRTARTVIGYNTLNAKDNVNWIDDVDAMVKDKDAALSAITKVSTDKKTISVIGVGDLDISNATILYVNSDDKTGQKDGSINEADKTADGKKYLANVLYAGLSGDEPDLVVIEQGRWFKSDAHKDDLVSANNDNLIYGGNEDGTTSNTGDKVNGIDNVTVSGSRVTPTGDLVFNITVTKPEWATDDAKYTVTYKVLDKNGKEIGAFTMNDLDAKAQKSTNSDVDFGAYDGVTVKPESLTASKVLVRYFNGETKLTVGDDQALAAATTTTLDTTGAQLAVTTGTWLAGQVSAKADFTITGATGGTLEGKEITLTNGNGVAQAANIGGADTKALGTGFVDVKFTNIKNSGTKYSFTVSADANAKTLKDYNILTKDKDSTLTFAWDKVNATANDIVKLTATINQIDAGSKYKVTVALPGESKTIIVDTQATATTVATFQPTQSIDLKKAMVTVTEIPSVQIAKAEVIAQDASAKTATIKLTFNQKLDTKTALVAGSFAFGGGSAPVFDAALYEDDGMAIILTTKTNALAADVTLTVSGLKAAKYGQEISNKAADKVTLKDDGTGKFVVDKIIAST